MRRENEAIVVITTCEEREEAETLSRLLLKSRVAACVQIETIRSHYRWEGRIEEAKEYRLQIKSLRSRWPEIERAIRETHRYDTPEILAVPVVEISQRYRQWLERECMEPLK